MGELQTIDADRVRHHLDEAESAMHCTLHFLAIAGEMIGEAEASMEQAEFSAWLANDVGVPPARAEMAKRAHASQAKLLEQPPEGAFKTLMMSAKRATADTSPKGGVDVVLKWKQALDKTRKEFRKLDPASMSEADKYVLRNELRWIADLWEALK